MHKFRAKAIAHAVSRSSGNVATAEGVSKDDDLVGKAHSAIKYTLAKAGVYKKLHRI